MRAGDCVLYTRVVGLEIGRQTGRMESMRGGVSSLANKRHV